ncbi:MAG: MFS transporter [Bacteroidales bacterium]|nr:MFS transporter [Bacteroidales bacterium]
MPKSWIKNVVLFLGSQTISNFGSSLVQYAIMWHITLETKSGLMMTISIICGFVPAFFLSPFAGVWADRYNRKLIIILSDSFIAIATLILAILFMFGHNYIWLLFVVMAMRSIGSGIQNPAVGAIIPQFVPQNKLKKVNGINSSINSMVLLLSPMLAAFLLTFASIESIFFIDVFTALFAVLVFLFFIKVPSHAKALDRKAKTYLQDMKEGINYIKTHKYIKNFIIYCIFFYFLIAPVSFLTPLQVVRNYGSEVWRLTFIEIAFSIGMMVGGIIIGYFRGFKNKINMMAFAFSITGLTTFLLGFSILFWFYCAIIVLMGIAVPLFHTTSTVLIQEKVEQEYLGRVFGILAMINTSMVPLGMVVFGPIADIVSIDTILIITGIIIIILSYALSKNKTLLSEGK